MNGFRPLRRIPHRWWLGSEWWIVARERRHPAGRQRIPEPMVMNDPDSVAQFHARRGVQPSDGGGLRLRRPCPRRARATRRTGARPGRRIRPCAQRGPASTAGPGGDGRGLGPQHARHGARAVRSRGARPTCRTGSRRHHGATGPLGDVTLGRRFMHVDTAPAAPLRCPACRIAPDRGPASTQRCRSLDLRFPAYARPFVCRRRCCVAWTRPFRQLCAGTRSPVKLPRSPERSCLRSWPLQDSMMCGAATRDRCRICRPTGSPARTRSPRTSTSVRRSTVHGRARPAAALLRWGFTAKPF